MNQFDSFLAHGKNSNLKRWSLAGILSVAGEIQGLAELSVSFA